MSLLIDRLKSIDVKNTGGKFEVSWNYQNSPGGLERLIQCERLDGYVDGFIDGLLVALEIPCENIHRSLSLKCTVKYLEEHVALKLEKYLTGFFQLLINHEHKTLSSHSVKSPSRHVG